MLSFVPSMDCDIQLSDFAATALQEVWKRLAFATKALAKEAREVASEKGSTGQFSKQIAELSTLLEVFHSKRVEIMNSEVQRAALEALYCKVTEASKIIKEYKSSSQLRLIFEARSFHQKMEDQAKGIADAISLLEFANLNVAVNLKNNVNQISDNLRSIRFRSAITNEAAIASDIENRMLQDEGSQDQNIKLLHKIAEAVGVNVDASFVENELRLLKQEKEHMEAQKKLAEALQLSQLIQLLHRTEMVSSKEECNLRARHQISIDSFTCPLCRELMTDPVVIDCGHSFQRMAIQKHFSEGWRTCPTCNEELTTLDLIPNISLQGSVEEWSQRETDLKFQAALSGMASDDPVILNKSLESLQNVLELPQYIALMSQNDLIPKIVKVLKDNSSNKIAALKCLRHLSSYSDENKEAIVRAGAIRYIIRHISKGEVEPDAVAILLELSTKETLVEHIGNAKDCITLLVSLLHSNIIDISQKAERALQNLSSNTQFVISMANVGYFQPFLARFNEGSSKRRALMAAALANMQLCNEGIKNFEEKEFIHNLVKMLSSSASACRTACLNCMEKILIHPTMIKWFLEEAAVSLLIGLLSSASSEEDCRKKSVRVLTTMVKATQLSDFSTHKDLQELQSQHNICLLWELAVTSNPELKAQLLQLLLVLTQKSEVAQDLIRTDVNSITKLFSFLNSNQSAVRRQAIKLIYSISKDHPAGVPLPEGSEKEAAIDAIVAILTSSPETKERSTAAGIISRLPTDDIVIDEILHRSEALKAIQEVICNCDIDDECCRTKMPINTSELLLENALAAFVRYTQTTKPELQRQVSKLELYPSLVRVLSTGSSLAKQRTAKALANLCRISNLSMTEITRSKPTKFFSMTLPLEHRIFSFNSCMPLCWSAPMQGHLCAAHGSNCSSRHTLCLVKVDAVRPLVHMLNDPQSGTAEAALAALSILLADQSTSSHTASAIVDNKGVVAMLEMLEKGSLPSKSKALDLFQQIVPHIDIKHLQHQRTERILIHLLAEDALKRKAALVLRQMNLIPEQSSYF